MAALSIAAGALVLFRIGHDSFWTDEAASLRFLRQNGWPQIWTADNGNMALYLALLKLWVVWAKSEATIRLLSAIPFVLTVPSVALLGRRMGGNTVGLLAAAVVASHPLFVRYGQEARGFSLVTLLLTAGALGMTAGIQDGRRAIFVLGVLLLALAPYAHPIAVAAGAALIVWLWWLPPQVLPVRRITVVALFAVVVMPLVVIMGHAGTGQLDWTGKGKSGLVVSALAVAWHSVSNTPAGIIVGTAAAGGCVLAVARIRREGHTLSGWIAGVPAVWVVATGAFVLIGSLRQSLLVPRYVLLVVPAIALLAASATVRVPWRKIAIALLVAAVFVNGVAVVQRGGAYRPEKWRQAQAFVAARSRPGDGVLITPTPTGVSFEYYELQSNARFPAPILPQGRWGALQIGLDKAPDEVSAHRASILSHDRIWLVVAEHASARFIHAFESALAPIDELARHWYFGKLNVRLYKRR